MAVATGRTTTIYENSCKPSIINELNLSGVNEFYCLFHPVHGWPTGVNGAMPHVYFMNAHTFVEIESAASLATDDRANGNMFYIMVVVEFRIH